MFKFDDQQLANDLAVLSDTSRAAFAAACAQRLMPCWIAYTNANQDSCESSSVVTEGLDKLWSVIEVDDYGQTELCILLDEISKRIPSEDEAWDIGVPYAEDAASIVAYAIQAKLENSCIAAMYCAKRAYEVADNFAINSTNDRACGKLDEKKIANSAVVQNELRRQQRDIRKLRKLEKRGAGAHEIVSSMRNAAVAESSSFFLRNDTTKNSS